MCDGANLTSALAEKIGSGAPVPEQDPAELNEPVLAYRQEPVVKQGRSAEPLVRLDLLGIASYSYYACDDGHNPPYYRQLAGSFEHVWCRQGVADKLLDVNNALRQFNVELLVLDGYRTLACQRELWTRFITLGRELHPDYSEEELLQFAQGFGPLAGPIDRDDATTWPTHSTGGAVDLTLRTLRGAAVFMGGVFDDPGWISHCAACENLAQRIPRREDAVSASYLEARDKRRLLYWAMTLSGFTNIPSEWWHYDWGNQQWCFRRLKAEPSFAGNAWYGFSDPPDEPQLPGQGGSI